MGEQERQKQRKRGKERERDRVRGRGRLAVSEKVSFQSHMGREGTMFLKKGIHTHTRACTLARKGIALRGRRDITRHIHWCCEIRPASDAQLPVTVPAPALDPAPAHHCARVVIPE